MKFQTQKAVYLQLADQICLDILEGRYKPGERVRSVREAAADAEVNVNTAMRTYEWLRLHGILRTERGMGYFVEADAPNLILQMRRTEFLEVQLPALLREMNVLGISMRDFEREWNRYNKQTRRIDRHAETS